ncbi:MAG: hypothetical protein ACRCS9_08825 [Hyphomicrobium sp.]
MSADAKPQPNYARVQALIADAEAVPSLKRFADDPEPGLPRENVPPGQWTPDALGLPPDCPVVPLGVDGVQNWFLDPIGQLYCYAKPYGQADTLELFRGRHLYLYWAWPKWKGKGEDAIDVDGWKNEKARECLIAAATAKGPWSAVDKVRGRGCWADGQGGLMVHLGNRMISIAGGHHRDQPPGESNGFVYPTRPRVPGPWGWPRPIEDDSDPAATLKLLFSTWSWSRPDVDPHLLLGWIGVAFLGAALPWRSAVYMTGDKGSGKSKLQEIMGHLFGDWLIQTTNTTAAGIYQHVKQDCLPVAVDEFEAKADNNKAVPLLELARQASSGGKGMRGGDRGTGTEFTIKSAFLFSSINAPPMDPQDLSRFALLRLHKLREGAKPPPIDPRALGELGRIILRRLIEEFQRFEVTWWAFKDELAAGGMDGRGQDTFGTLLACADMIAHRGWNPERLSQPHDGDVKAWRDILAPTTMAEFDDATANWQLCLDHMLSVPVEAWRTSARSTVGQALEAWFKGDDDHFGTDIVKIRHVLGQAGLTLERKAGLGDYLAVPNNNPLTRRLFEATKWAGHAGAGVWSQALRQGPRDAVWTIGQARVNGVKCKCTLIALNALYGDGGMMTADGKSLRKTSSYQDESEDLSL